MPMRAAASVSLTKERMRAAMPALVAVALAIAMSWPLTLHFASAIGGDLGDPLFFTWQLALIGDATLHQPLDFFQANILWPLRDTLAFTGSLMGYAPPRSSPQGPGAHSSSTTSSSCSP
jgi:hypothetical protein